MGADETIHHWHSRLIEEIETYVNDMERRYPIALEGDWGVRQDPVRRAYAETASRRQ